MLKGKRLFLNYLITYLVIIALIAVTMMFMLKAMINVQISDAEQAQHEKLNMLVEILDDRFNQYDSVATLMYMDSRVSPLWIRQNMNNAMEAIRELRVYSSKCSDLAELFLCLDGDKIYSSQGYSMLQTFIENRYHLTPESRDAFIECITGRQAACCVLESNYSSKQPSRLYYHCALPVNETNTSSAVGFIIDLSDYTRQLDSLLGDNSGYVCVAMADGTVIAELGDRALMSVIGEKASHPFFSNGQKQYEYQEMALSHLGLACHMITNTRQVTAPIYRIWEPTILALVVLLLAAVALSFLFSNYNYRPIHTLYNAVVTLPNAGNELDAIQQVFAITTEEIGHLQSYQNNSKALICEQALRMMFEGNEDDEAAARQMLTFAGMDPLPDWYAVAVVEAPIKALHGFADSRINLPHFFLCYNNKDCMCLLLSADSDEGLPEMFGEKAYSLRTSIDPNARIGVGQIYDIPGRIRRSMNEALAALDRCEMGNTEFFSTMTQMCSTEVGIEESMRIETALAIKSRDTDAMMRQLFALIENLKSEEYAEEKRSFIMYDMVHIVVGSLIEMGLEHSFLDELMQIDTSSVQRFEITMQTLFQHISDTKRENECFSGRFAKIKAYLDNSFSEPTLSAESVAERFNITRGHLSKTFKEEAGVTYIEYVTQLRIQEAKRRLKETNDSIQTILESVGYHDAASFHRKFKQITGQTPMQYRESCNSAFINGEKNTNP